ncbi:MAG TPA: DNA repair protein RadC [Polyangiaceae bacterium]|jgi:DNA repair protein RadC
MNRGQGGPRERAVEEGLGALGDAELVALVLGTGHADEPVTVLAAALLVEAGGLEGLARAGLGELSARRGVGLAKGARLAAAVELGRRVAAALARRADARFPTSAAVDGWARPRLASLDHEELWALVLDGHQGLRAARRVASGGLHGMHVGARDPLRVALRDGGSAFVLVHNHPSGDPSASREDLRFTEQVAEAADVIGVPLLDHVIVARGGYLSMLDNGVLRSGGAEPPPGGLRSRASLHVPAGASSSATASLAEGWQRFT